MLASALRRNREDDAHDSLVLARGPPARCRLVLGRRRSHRHPSPPRRVSARGGAGAGRRGG
ncbi:hypothetical protein NITMOv2_4607 [Nitrospira moscoviensis]|uniref:Uncharacterized protein n=1 Tax=Nitrospira moscoviensis TaxID=42253 RepID=A0A0K2GJF0_NITMO|nr:hypothetical protein NITMOv2_4607 [Nitrospira moscoviensis]